MTTYRIGDARVVADEAAGSVTTVWRDGCCTGTREATPENVAQANEQGYSGADACWRSLLHHELAHSFLAERIYNRPSPTLRHVAGVEPCEYWKQMAEEAVTLCWQIFICTGRVERPLEPFAGELPAWRSEFLALLAAAEEPATKLDACPVCEGTGEDGNVPGRLCEACEGLGWLAPDEGGPTT